MKKGKEIMWETHCDTIGDIFKNRYMQKFLIHWYGIQNKWKQLKVMTKKGEFSQDFYSFVRETFSDLDSMEEFLSEMRAKFLLKKKFFQKIQRDYDNDDIVLAFLCLRELNDQLESVNRITVWSAFSTRIVDILRDARSENAHFENDPENDYNPYMDIPVYYAIEKALNLWILPITECGELIGIIQESQWDNYIASNLIEDGIFEVDMRWNHTNEIEKTRDTIRSEIKQLERILEYYLAEDKEFTLTSKDQKVFDLLSDEYDIASQNWVLLAFDTFLGNNIQYLEESFQQAKVKDRTQVHQLEKRWLLWEWGQPILHVFQKEWGINQVWINPKKRKKQKPLELVK
jgi:hypothetical protein